jgi:hypothetical protein
MDDNGVMSGRAGLRERVWRLTHPRQTRRLDEGGSSRQAVEERARRVQQARDALRPLQEQRAIWRAIAHDPKATPDALRRVVIADRDALEHALHIMHDAVEHINGDFADFFREFQRWRRHFYATVSAHPNLPLELFGQELSITPLSVAGLLRNPVCPLLLFERPDFVEALSEDNRRRLTYYALQHNEMPRGLYQALMPVRDPWLSLEAKTHRLAGEDTALPDLAWLDAQVVQQMHDEARESWRQRCLLLELGWHRLISSALLPTFRCQEANNVSRRGETDQIVAAFVHRAEAFRWGDCPMREQWLNEWVLELFEEGDRSGRGLSSIFAAVQHPRTPGWVHRYIACGWGEGSVVWSPHRLLTVQERTVRPDLIKRFRRRAVGEALCYRADPRGWWNTSPGIFYLVFRDLTTPLTGTALTTRSDDLPHGADFATDIGEASFLVRLAVALRLDDTIPEQAQLRRQLGNDPNRYVRAAARKEIVWTATGVRDSVGVSLTEP